MEHNNKKYNFCGEISEILPNTPRKVAPETTFVGKTVKFHPYLNTLLVKYINLITLRWGDYWKTSKFLMRAW